MDEEMMGIVDAGSAREKVAEEDAAAQSWPDC